ncbi:MAG: hypothetical protein HY840_12000 [Bacteroidetes bacterium]|nr:hypothetical protein [Bacteroidota bacterium]
MKTTILSLSALTIAFFSVHANAFAQKKEKDKVLANKVYTIDLTETGSKKTPKPESDEISFKGDKLNSKFMSSEYKFSGATYTVSVDSSSESKEITFECLSKNPDGEELKWDVTITDDAIEGTAVISKKGKTKKEYSFSGTQKVKPGKK